MNFDILIFLNILFKIYIASLNVFTLKNIQVKHIKIKVITILIHFFILFNALSLNSNGLQYFLINSCPILKIPLRAPHIIYVQLAPCHIPDSINTVNKFKSFLLKPFLLPPSGIYT